MAQAIDVSTIKGVLFDLDGTLVNSGLNFDSLRKELGIAGGQPVLEYLATLNDPGHIAQVKQVIAQYEMDGAKKACWMPGAQSLLQQLHRQQIPTAIITRNMRAATQLTLKNLGICVDQVLTREDCKPKPAPDALLHVAATWQLPVTALVYIGDYTFDIDAAHNAQMTACLYRNQRNAALAAKADWVIEHFDELTQRFKSWHHQQSPR